MHIQSLWMCARSLGNSISIYLRLSASWAEAVTQMFSHLLQSKAAPMRLAALLVLLLLPSFFTACSGSSFSPSRARANTPPTGQGTVAPAPRPEFAIYFTGPGPIEAHYT